MVRSNVEIMSNLPTFDARLSKDFPEYLLVRCPRDDCPSQQKDGVRPFLVHKRTWTRPRKPGGSKMVIIYGRVCPYCHKVSRLPKVRRQV
jgi:hypothetical protein